LDPSLSSRPEDGLSVAQETFLDAGNGLFTPFPQLGLHVFTATGTAAANATVPTGAGPYSVTELIVFDTHGASGSFSSTIDVSGVPEPSTWAMMLIGFAGLGFALHRSRRKMSFA
jgi:hypothetical protein